MREKCLYFQMLVINPNEHSVSPKLMQFIFCRQSWDPNQHQQKYCDSDKPQSQKPAIQSLSYTCSKEIFLPTRDIVKNFYQAGWLIVGLRPIVLRDLLEVPFLRGGGSVHQATMLKYNLGMRNLLNNFTI